MSKGVVSREVLRPGIARGPYPERVPEREDFLERAAHGLRGLLLGAQHQNAIRSEEIVEPPHPWPETMPR